MTVIELLAKQAAEQRELSRERGVAATEAKPAVAKAAAAMTETRKQVEALERAIVEAREAHDAATDRHAEALAAVAEHEAEAQQAADIAESLDRIAKQMREQAKPTLPPEAVEGVASLTEPPKVVDTAAIDVRDCRHCGGDVAYNQLLRHWEHLRDGEVKCWPDEHDTPVAAPDEPASDGRPTNDDGVSFGLRPADPGTVARVTNALPVTQPPVPGDPDPGVTMPDLGPARPPLDPPPGHGVHTHAKPGDGLMSRLTGGWPTIGRRRTDEQDGDDR